MTQTTKFLLLFTDDESEPPRRAGDTLRFPNEQSASHYFYMASPELVSLGILVGMDGFPELSMRKLSSCTA